MVGDRLVQLELHAPQPVGDVDVVDALDENGPGVGVVVGYSWGFGVGLGIERPGGGAVNKGAEYLHAFYALACWRCHGEGRGTAREGRSQATQETAGGKFGCRPCRALPALNVWGSLFGCMPRCGAGGDRCAFEPPCNPQGAKNDMIKLQSLPRKLLKERQA